jgi:hypothetical protein
MPNPQEFPLLSVLKRETFTHSCILDSEWTLCGRNASCKGRSFVIHFDVNVIPKMFVGRVCRLYRVNSASQERSLHDAVEVEDF